ncbi:hypothetical protein KKA33_00515 [Patescibacteria group bacterium]|nr:hypothetical protein [Patescibacteria group bacterium]
MNKRTFSKLTALLVAVFFGLTACGGSGSESPETVMQKFKDTAKDIKAADFSVTLAMKGVDKEDNIDFDLYGDIKLDRREDVERKADADVKVEGVLNAGGKSLDGRLDFKIRTLGENFYFNLMALEANDPGFENLKPIIEPLKTKWQHLASDFVPESIRELQQKDPETLEREAQLKELFVKTKLFDVIKEYGDESLKGKKVYHYGLRINKDGLKAYTSKAAAINGREMTDAEAEEAALFADSVTNMEMWIGVKDYYLYKGVVTLGSDNPENNVSSEVSLTYLANSYDTDMNIEPPAAFEEFNPITLMMGLQMPVMSDEEGAITDEENDMTEAE